MLINNISELDLFEEVIDGDKKTYQVKSIKQIGIKGWLVVKPCDNKKIKLFWNNEEACRNAELNVYKETEKAYAIVAIIGCTHSADDQYGLVWVPKSQCFDKSNAEELKKVNEAIDREKDWESKR